ncbi:oxygenase MpaB family protein [Corallococcus sp. EGB]|uniref:oxygenase MpaB family protein n=1 Tax=Corallococcus sp. EGB TaxID=1521117 RepID=UPI001CBFB54C|nr:oxygenase MpaB family protein [Corallococcus sp. EGB]
MPFVFRGQNLDAILGDPLNAANSLYGIMSAADPQFMEDLRLHWKKHVRETPGVNGTAWRPALKAFAAIAKDWWSTYSDHRLAGILYGTGHSVATAAVTGAQSSAQFLRDFEAARDEAFYVFFQFASVNELAGVSFQATYYHYDVSALFEQRAHSKLKAIVSRRVIETAQIMLRILYGNMSMGWGSLYSTRTLATTLLLAQMHNAALSTYRSRYTDRRCYNQSAVAFTLLTFSYIVAQAWRDKRYEFDEARWYSFWKLVGSLLGVDTRLIADNHAEAATLWELFFEEHECQGGPSAPNPTTLDPRRINSGLRQGYAVQPEANLLQWVPAFIVTQLRNGKRWGKYLIGR